MAFAKTVVIESGIPLPTPKKGGGLTETLKKMRVGDSFIYPGKNGTSYPWQCAKRAGAKIKTAKTDRGMRVWRVA